MANLFVSYNRHDLSAAHHIVQGLRDAGIDVWWDQDIAPGAPWEATIERQLNAAKVVIVAWSRAAVVSENVKAEARRARNAGKLIQVFVEPCEPPLFFGEQQGVDLSNWNGDENDARFKTVLEAARAIVAGKKPPQGVGYTPKKRTPWAALTAGVVFVGATLGFVSNLGGARDAVCSISTIHQNCLDWGLVAAAQTVESVQDQQARLIQSIAGIWGRLDRDCAETVAYSVEHEGKTWRIVGEAVGLANVMQVTATDPANGAVTARSTTPNEAGVRELWEYRPNGDVLALRDPAGTETTLARCG